MNQEAENLISAANTAAQSPAAKMAGISNALRLLVSWVLSIESRIERMQKHGNS